MARRTKNLAIVKSKQEKKPKLTMTSLEIRNERKTFLLKEEFENEQKNSKLMDTLIKIENDENISYIEKRIKEAPLLKELCKLNELLFTIDQELNKIEQQEKDERHQEALKNYIVIQDDDDSVKVFEIIDIDGDD